MGQAVAVGNSLLSISMRPEYNRWYNKQRWRKMAKAQLRKEPLCRRCCDRGDVVLASIADHIIPHRGDQNKFWFGKLQSLCKDCHDRWKQKEEIVELRGYSTAIGLDGYPVDKRHPIYQGLMRHQHKRPSVPMNEYISDESLAQLIAGDD